MRLFYKLLFAFSFLLSLQVSAAPYTFTMSSEPYQELTNPDFVIPDNSQYWNGGQILLKQNMTIKAFGTTFDLNDGIYMVMEQGYFYMIGTDRSLTFYNFQSDMQPRKGTTLSEFSYKLEGGAGSKVLKLQFKNMGFTAGTEEEYINYQVWLHERGPIEVRFGSNNVSTAAYGSDGGPAVGLLFMDEQFSSIYNQMYLKGSTSDPGTTTGNITGMTGTPAEGTVYRFVPEHTAAISEVKAPSHVTVYPNPTKDKLTAYMSGNESGHLMLTDLTGRIILQKHVSSAMRNQDLDISALPAGLYVLSFRTSAGSQTIRVVKE